MSSQVQRVRNNSFYLSINIIVTSTLGLLFWFIAARLVPLAELGEATITITIATLFAATAGTRIAASKFIGEQRVRSGFEVIRRVIKITGGLTLVGGLISMVVVLMISPWLAEGVYDNLNLRTLIPLVAIAIPFIAMWDFLNGIFIGLQKATYQLAVDTILSASRVAMLILLLGLGFQAVGIVMSFLLSYLIATMIGSIFVLRKIPFLRGSAEALPDQKLGRKIIGFSLTNYGSSIVIKMHTMFPILILGAFSLAVVPLYNIAYLVASVAIGLTATVGTALVPAISKEVLKSLDGASRLLNPTFARSLLLAGPIFVILIVFPENVLSLVSPEYTSAATTLRIISSGALFATMGVIIQSVLNGAGKARFVLGQTAIYTTVNILLSFILIPSLGMIGAALSFLVAGLLNSGLGAYLLVKRAHLRLDFVMLLRPLLCIGSGVLIGLTLLNTFGGSTLVVPLAVGITYLGIAFLSRAITQADFAILWKSIRHGVGEMV